MFYEILFKRTFNYIDNFQTKTETITTTTTTETEEFSVDLVSDLVSRLQTVISTTVTTVIRESFGTGTSSADLVDRIIADMSSEIRRVVTEAGSRQGFPQAKTDRLYRRLVAALRPVILASIEAYRTQYVQQQTTIFTSTINSDAFVRDLVEELRRQISRAVRITVTTVNPNAPFPDTETLVRQVRTNLRSVILDIVRRRVDFVPDGFFTSAEFDALVERIMSQVVVTIRTEITALLLERKLASAAFVESVADDVRRQIRSVVEITFATAADGGRFVGE